MGAFCTMALVLLSQGGWGAYTRLFRKQVQGSYSRLLLIM